MSVRFANQKEKILDLLHKKSKVSCSELMRLGIANHTARISELRSDGYYIVNQKKWNKKEKRYHSNYSLQV